MALSCSGRNEVLYTTPLELTLEVTAEPEKALPSPSSLLYAGSLGPAVKNQPLLQQRLDGALHVLRTELNALQKLELVYTSSPVCREGFFKSVDAITRRQLARGKVVFIGVGKSGHIAKKMTATFVSLGITSVFMHPTEALHGDLGIVGPNDCIIFVTFSGKTPELMLLLPHLPKSCAVIVLTSVMRPEACKIAASRPDMVLLPAPIPEPEEVSFGVSAPTTSITITNAVGDALAYVVSREMHSTVSTVFSKNHPGGAIGEAFQKH